MYKYILHTYVQAYEHTYIHTHMHTHIQIYIRRTTRRQYTKDTIKHTQHKKHTHTTKETPQVQSQTIITQPKTKNKGNKTKHIKIK